jgi:hypothetical protein
MTETSDPMHIDPVMLHRLDVERLHEQAARDTPIARCACGVPAGTAHYCAAQDHNWVKAPESADRDDD